MYLAILYDEYNMELITGIIDSYGLCVFINRLKIGWIRFIVIEVFSGRVGEGGGRRCNCY